MKVGTKLFSADDIITILARNLYYQNLISPIKPSDTDFSEQLNGLYTNSIVNNINSKRKFIFDTYLQYDSDLKKDDTPRLKDRANLSGMMIPSYDKK